MHSPMGLWGGRGSYIVRMHTDSHVWTNTSGVSLRRKLISFLLSMSAFIKKNFKEKHLLCDNLNNLCFLAHKNISALLSRCRPAQSSDVFCHPWSLLNTCMCQISSQAATHCQSELFPRGFSKNKSCCYWPFKMSWLASVLQRLLLIGVLSGPSITQTDLALLDFCSCNDKTCWDGTSWLLSNMQGLFYRAVALWD